MNRFRLATLTSLTAGLMIMAVLSMTAFIPLSSLFSWPLVSILWALWALGVAAYRLFSSSGLQSSNYIRKYTPYSLALTFVFVVAGMLRQELLMGITLMAGYSFELVAGFILFGDFKRIAGRFNAILFLIGITLFILALPLALIRLPWPAVAGVLLKTVSIARVALGAGRAPAVARRAAAA